VFQVAVSSAAAQLGTLDFAGTVTIAVEGETKPLSEFKLQPAWFSTIGEKGSRTAFMYGAKDTTIQLPAGKQVVAKVTVRPTVKTNKGLVALWPNTVDVVLQQKK